MGTYPIFLELEGRPCLVIGGGPVARRKASALISCGAKVTVVSPTLAADLHRLRRDGRIRWRRRGFRPSDLSGFQLAVAATDDEAVNRAAAREGRRRGVWINVVDQPELCSFILPSVVRRGRLALAVSTGGASPALAKWIRRDLQGRYGVEFGRLLKRVARVREKVKRAVPTAAGRKRLFEKALKAYLETLRRG